MQPAKRNGQTLIMAAKFVQYYVLTAATPNQQYFIFGEQMSPKGSHVCLFALHQSLAATAKCPHIQTDPQHKHLLAMRSDQYSGLRNVRCCAVCYRRLGRFVIRIFMTLYQLLDIIWHWGAAYSPSLLLQGNKRTLLSSTIVLQNGTQY